MKVGDWSRASGRITEAYRAATDRDCELVIGKFCSIAGELVVFLGGEHRTDLLSTYHFSDWWPGMEGVPGTRFSKGDVTIGNDVWIGYGVTIMSGVTIGDGACVGAKSVVTKDVGPYEVWAGNPARYIRTRFPPEDVAFLLRAKWWDWEEEKLARAIPLLMGKDLDALRRMARE